MNKEQYKELLRLRKTEEMYMWIVIKANKGKLTPRQLYNLLLFETMSHNRFEYLLRKWARKGIYDYGVALDLGWIERKLD